ncbi:MAG: hypothetical protein ABIU58_08490 [Ramlibacter sp.]
MTELIILAIVALFATFATAYAGVVRSIALRRKFEQLGQVTGRSLEEVLRHVGKPNRREPAGNGRELLFWRRINFQVVLRFTGGMCDGMDYTG